MRATAWIPFVLGVTVACTPVSSGSPPTATPGAVPSPTVTPSATPSPRPTASPIPQSTPATSTTPTATASPTATPSATLTPTAPPAAALYLSGPFGYLDGVVTTRSWPSAEDLRALDSYVRTAPLGISFRDHDLLFWSWTATAAPADTPSDGTAVLLGRGPGAGDAEHGSFAGPEPGEWIVRVDALPAGGTLASYHWLLSVPDRPTPASGQVVPPLPDLLVTVDGREELAEPGSFCYVTTCGDIGPLPRARELPRLRADRGDTLTIGLSDGSGFTSWTASAWPSEDRDGASERPLDEGSDADGTETVDLQLPATGDWVLNVFLAFDLERGDASYYIRLVVR